MTKARCWSDGFNIGDRVVFYNHHGTITGYYPAATTPDEYGEMEPEFWEVTIDVTGQVALGYINEFDFLV